MNDELLLDLSAIEVHFHGGRALTSLGRRSAPIRAVDGVSLAIRSGEIVGLVGESGAGKTTLAKVATRLVQPTRGRVSFRGDDITRVTSIHLRAIRRDMQFIFQDPHASLSPRHRLGYLLTEPYAIHETPAGDRLSADELLRIVDLRPEIAQKFPHEVSGGQARRINIARALALRPAFLVADEPTAGLDVSAAASVLNLMNRLRNEFGLTYLIVTHNLNVVSYFADRIAVMYLGQLVEEGPTESVLTDPRHPYTQGLVMSLSEPDPLRRRTRGRGLIGGEMPSPANPPPGCRFHTRCAFAQQLCVTEPPPSEVRPDGGTVACHFWRDFSAPDTGKEHESGISV